MSPAYINTTALKWFYYSISLIYGSLSCCWEEEALIRGVVVAGRIPEEPQFGQKCGVLLGFFWGRLRGLLVLQTQPLDLLEDLPE